MSDETLKILVAVNSLSTVESNERKKKRRETIADPDRHAPTTGLFESSPSSNAEQHRPYATTPGPNSNSTSIARNQSLTGCCSNAVNSFAANHEYTRGEVFRIANTSVFVSFYIECALLSTENPNIKESASLEIRKILGVNDHRAVTVVVTTSI